MYAIRSYYAIAVINGQGVIIIERHTIGRTTGNDVVDDVLTTLAADIGLDLVLVDLNRVAPGPDDREIGSLDRVHAIVRTSRSYNFV